VIDQLGSVEGPPRPRSGFTLEQGHGHDPILLQTAAMLAHAAVIALDRADG